MSHELVDDSGGVTVLRDGHPQSHVDLRDPELLAFEYIAHMAAVLDVMEPAPPRSLAVTHVGGGGLTLPRYVEATRPGSTQVVLEPDAALTDAVRQRLPLPRGHRIRVRAVDGRSGIGALRDASAQVICLDAYDAGRVPGELTTVEWFREVARVLQPGGVAVANLADEPGLRFVGAVAVSGAAAGLVPLALVATHDVLKGRRFGNTVLVLQRPVPAGADQSGARPDELVDRLVRRVALSAFPTGVRQGGELSRLIRSARVATDAAPAESPVPPGAGAWRVR